MYGITNINEKNFFPFMSDLTNSQAITPPIVMLIIETERAINSEFNKGLYKRDELSSENSSLVQ